MIQSFCFSCGKELKTGFFVKKIDESDPSNPNFCFGCVKEGKAVLPDTKREVVQSGIRDIVHADNNLWFEIGEVICNGHGAFFEATFKRVFGVHSKAIHDFLWTDDGPDHVWGAMTRKQQILALRAAGLGLRTDAFIEKFAHPETEEDVVAEKLVKEMEEAKKRAAKHRHIPFRVKTLQGFNEIPLEYVHISTDPKAHVCISDSVSHIGKSLGVKTSNIVAVEIVTPGAYARRDEYVAQAVQPNKLTNAAAGAALGFLLAGPLGTALGGLYGAGAAAGSGRASRLPQKESNEVGLIGFDDGSGLIVKMSKHKVPDFENLKLAVGQLLEQKTQAAAAAEYAAEYKECPMCAEDVKAKAKICRFCAHEFA